jgi:hypothetical protein
MTSHTTSTTRITITSARSMLMAPLLEDPDEDEDDEQEQEKSAADVHRCLLGQPEVVDDDEQGDQNGGEPERAHGYLPRIEIAGVKAFAGT